MNHFPHISHNSEPPKLPSDLESLPAKPKYSYNTTETGESVAKGSETGQMSGFFFFVKRSLLMKMYRMYNKITFKKLRNNCQHNCVCIFTCNGTPSVIQQYVRS